MYYDLLENGSVGIKITLYGDGNGLRVMLFLAQPRGESDPHLIRRGFTVRFAAKHRSALCVKIKVKTFARTSRGDRPVFDSDATVITSEVQNIY